MRWIICIVLLIAVGCTSAYATAEHEARFLVPAEMLRMELKNPDYQWLGPTSNEDRIPVLHAARALAYRGDSSAEVLFDAVDDSDVEIISVLDAMSELGIPVHRFHDEIMARDSSTVRAWWAQNRELTLDERTQHRRQIGLPPAKIGT